MHAWVAQHHDSNAGAGWESEQIGHGIASRTVKAFIYINDVAEDQGCTSVVRHSHRVSPLVGGPNSLFDFISAGAYAHSSSSAHRT